MSCADHILAKFMFVVLLLMHVVPSSTYRISVKIKVDKISLHSLAHSVTKIIFKSFNA